MLDDVVTSHDLPELRTQMIAFASNHEFSDAFRDMCLDAVNEIDRAVADDAAVNARLQLALESWKRAADVEVSTC